MLSKTYARKLKHKDIKNATPTLGNYYLTDEEIKIFKI